MAIDNQIIFIISKKHIYVKIGLLSKLFAPSYRYNRAKYKSLLVMQMMFSFMLTDENSGLKLCRKCTKAFVSEGKKELYCSKCKENLML